MPDRQDIIERFIADSGWRDASLTVLAGDASTRRYFRVFKRDGSTAVLMDADGDATGVDRFVQIGNLLGARGLSVPQIIAQKSESGLLLLEDLGDDLFARVLEIKPELESDLYDGAIDVLVNVAGAPLPNPATHYFSPEYLKTAAAAVGWYPGVDTAAKSEILTALQSALKATDEMPRCLSLRDFHAENLMVLIGREGIGRTGIIDYQDAAAGHPAYDVISLLSDARRDVSQEVRRRGLARYIDATGHDTDRFCADAAALGAQRNLRILTQFARLALRDGKLDYLGHMPRVWKNLMRELDHPSLGRLRQTILDHLQPPTPDLVQEIRDTCSLPLAH